ncbi:hypothetical protein BKA66DRAFT_432832, partial [Pyrenochaeta sp. MPI-SDFR-AT-0127]
SPLWSAFQARVQPKCRIEPITSTQVAQSLSIIRQHDCHFAVLGGGTSPFKGASNADQGITISLRRMKEVKLISGDTPSVRVGGGVVWGDVYHVLDGMKMSATGTRNSLTGVVGSVLGGGISFFSEHHGWACDTVLEFEVVLANSTIVRASPNSSPDLFWALKGGGNNFGIITSVLIEVFPDPPEWYSFQLFNIADMDIVFNRLENHTLAMPDHVWQIATTLQWHIPTQAFVISERMVSSKQLQLPASVSRIDEAGSVKQSSVLQSNTYRRSILAMSQKMDGMNPEGFYNFFGSVTVKSHSQVSMVLAEIFQDEVHSIKDEPNLQIYIVYNPLTRAALHQMKKRGGNSLGLVEDDGPLTVININLHWSKEDSEAKMRRFMRSLVSRFRSKASSMDMLHPYIFQNHAYEEQNVFAGSGDVKLTRLKEVRRSVDPHAVFQRLQPGFFKLEHEEAEVQLEKSEL